MKMMGQLKQIFKKKDEVSVSEKEDGGYGCDDVNMDDGPYWDILGCNWAVLGSPGLCWTVVDCTGLYRTALGCNGLYRTVLD